MMGFVKKTFKDSHSKLVDRLVEKSHLLESESANKRLNMLKEVAPGERMGHGSIFIAPPPGYQEFGADGQEQKLHPHLGHESMGSNDSNLSEPHSAGLSQASTFTSPSSHLSSPPQSHRQPHHQHSHSQDSNYKGPFQFAPAPALQEPVSEEQDQLSQLSYLPSTTYNPHAQETSTPETHKKAAATYSLLPAVAYNPRPQLRARAKTESQTPQLQVHELPAQGPPVPPKNEHIAELPA
jgi:DNA polymerase III gamma/tau subunit